MQEDPPLEAEEVLQEVLLGLQSRTSRDTDDTGSDLPPMLAEQLLGVLLDMLVVYLAEYPNPMGDRNFRDYLVRFILRRLIRHVALPSAAAPAAAAEAAAAQALREEQE